MMDKSKSFEEQPTGRPLEGIVCDVNNCIYNEQNHYCTAPHIKVGPNFAATKNDTACVTFEHR